MIISERWRFIYIKLAESSSSAILKAMHKICSEASGEERKCNEEEFTRVRDPRTIDDQTWNDFFVFTIVRNPWARMLSAYKTFTRNFLRKCASHIRLDACSILSRPRSTPHLGLSGKVCSGVETYASQPGRHMIAQACNPMYM